MSSFASEAEAVASMEHFIMKYAYSSAHLMGRSRDEGLKEDLCQAGRIGAMKAWREFTIESYANWAAWEIRYAISIELSKSSVISLPDDHRKRRDDPDVRRARSIGTGGSAADIEWRSTGVCQADVAREKVERILSLLKKRHADALRMKYGIGMEKMSHEEIAATMGISRESSEEMVRWAKKRARVLAEQMSP